MPAQYLSGEKCFSMGIPYELAALALHARRAGLDLSVPLCLGRLRMSVRPYELAALADRLAPDVDARAREHALASPWGEPFLEMLGAQTIEILDASAYEGATLVYSLNEPVPEALHGRFSVIIDGGTLEHVFNIPTAFDSIMRMLRPGGVLLSCGPGNNQLGGGFYQFSPELYYRVFTPANGCRVLGVFLAATGQSCWWQVRDPAETGNRTVFRAHGDTRILCVAVKDAEDAALREIPAQSAYSTAWEDAPPASPQPEEEEAPRRVSAAKSRLHALLPRGLVTGFRDRRAIRRAVRKSAGDLMQVDPLGETPWG